MNYFIQFEKGILLREQVFIISYGRIKKIPSAGFLINYLDKISPK